MTLTPLIVIISTLIAIVIIFSTNTAESKPLFTTEQPSITKHETIFSSTLSPASPIKDRNTGSSSSSCITYAPSTRTITVTCTSASMTEIYNKLQDNSILSKQSSPQGGTSNIWFLNANLIIAKGATFHIDSTDTKWLKISSKVTRGAGSAKIAPAYILDVHGSLKIDSVKITSWDPTTNYYAITNGSRTGDITHPGAPRPSIVVENNATGTTDITNSEIAYLGYEQGQHKGGSGLSYYYGGDGSIIRNNDIHHVYFGLYTFGVGHMIIENNTIRDSGHYGLDPHTGTHDMIIRNNKVYDNNGSGIICSLNCYNILIENNKVHDNTGDGIDFSRNMYDSIARNNIIYNEHAGVLVSQSHNNQIYNNTVSTSGNGIYVNSGSANNKMYDNTIMNSKSHAILINNGCNDNIFYSNKIVSAIKEGLEIGHDATSTNNLFSNNQVINSASPNNTIANEIQKKNNSEIDGNDH
ncbi:MAG: right-handed parallel beta-helix repeat-containing protein [Thermoproteota archaeon]|nr:right-handed parallel beta-helix repeat-containing protein [Thermoproteota archaeon]